MKNTIEETIILENLNYTQLMAHSLNELSFNEFVESHRTTNLNHVYSTLISCIHSANDAKVLNEDCLKAICNFLNINESNVDELISSVFKRYKGFIDDSQITLSEFRNGLQCLQFIIKTHSINLNKLATFGEIMQTVQSIKNVELV
jgi:hypothetical protein